MKRFVFVPNRLGRLVLLVVIVALLMLWTAAVAMADSGMPQAPDWGYFWTTVVGSGAIVLLLVDFLIVWLPPSYGAWLKANASIIVAILTALCPQIANAVLSRWPTVDPVPWTIIALGLPWVVHQILYWLQKRALGKLLPKPPG
jgi:hypothetical protein